MSPVGLALLFDDALEFETFYQKFLKPYYQNIKCEDARKALKALDMDKDGKVEWSECMVYVKWAIYEYPDISDLDELLSAFTDQLMHSMKKQMIQDLVGNRKEEYMSPVGLALLFDRAGGHLNVNMRNVIDKWEITTSPPPIGTY